MSRKITVSDPVYEQAEKLAEELDVSLKEAVSRMCREGGYDV